MESVRKLNLTIELECTSDIPPPPAGTRWLPFACSLPDSCPADSEDALHRKGTTHNKTMNASFIDR